MESTTTNTAPIQDELITEQFVDDILNAILSGVTVADICNTAPETIEGLYALAYNLYTAKDYKNAETVFQALCMYKHNDYRFWMGLAGSKQENGDFKGAIDAYAMAGVSTQLKNPEPFIFAAQCYIRLNDKENAINSLKGLLVIVDENNPAHTPHKEKAQTLLKLLESKD